MVGNILIISKTQSYLTTNLKSQLEGYGFDVNCVDFKVQSIFENTKDPEAIILFVEEDYEENIQEILYVKDRCIEVCIPVFIMGDGKNAEELSHDLLGIKVPGIFARPIDVKAAAQTINEFVKENSRKNKKKILVVDDSGAVLRNVKGWLEDRYDVMLTNSGTTAIKAMALNKPDLILLDYEMPIVDGSQVLQMIRSESEFCDIPVIFLTSKSDKETVMKVMALKPDGYLLKTLPPEEIVASVNDFFEKQRQNKILF